ncbi:hypothetical protein GY45DRAFT_1340610 [Cubamyces sp. BRFM 1775]|nr:hypothetical protein GY45DRAFT_1340610 [Cubamyces sp. BRFM 1775]
MRVQTAGAMNRPHWRGLPPLGKMWSSPRREAEMGPSKWDSRTGERPRGQPEDAVPIASIPAKPLADSIRRMRSAAGGCGIVKQPQIPEDARVRSAWTLYKRTSVRWRQATTVCLGEIEELTIPSYALTGRYCIRMTDYGTTNVRTHTDFIESRDIADRSSSACALPSASECQVDMISVQVLDERCGVRGDVKMDGCTGSEMRRHSGVPDIIVKVMK